MSLTVEDGTGLADADAFITLAAWKTYATARGYSYSAYTDPQVEVAIRRATDYLTSCFTWKGYRLNGRSQAQAWPRTSVVDEAGDTVASDALPAEIVQACAEAAWYELATGPLSPAVVLTDRVKREKIGPIETEYAATVVTADAARPVLTFLTDLIAGLLATGTNSLVGAAVRG